MKVSLNSALQVRKQPNYQPKFTSCEIQKDDYGERVYEWSFPFDPTKYNCYLDVYPIKPDKNGSYDKNDFKRKYVDIRTGNDYIKLNPGSNVLDFDYILGKAHNAPFAYHYRLQPKNDNDDNDKPNAFPIFMFDAGELIDKRNFSNDWESVYNIFMPVNNNSRKAGAAILIGADNFDVRYMYDEKGNIVPNPDAEKGFNTYKNFSNHIGGTLAGVHQALRDGRLDLYDKIFYLPHTSGDWTTPHGYWLESAYQLSSAGGTIDNLRKFNIELFVKGKTLVTDSALTSEGLNGIHIESILQHGPEDVFFDWFKANSLKNMTAKLGVFGKSTQYIRHKLINPPEYPEEDSNGNISWKENKAYEKDRITEVQAFNIDQATAEQASNLQLAIDKYGNPSGTHPLTYGTHNDTIIAYKKPINFETYKENVNRLNELNKTRRKQNKPIISLNSYMGTRIALKFEGFEFEDKIDGGFHNWDANVDIAKFDYAESNEDAEEAMNLPLNERRNFFIKKAQKRAEVLDYAVSSLKYWGKETNQELNLYVAQTLRGMNTTDAQAAKEFLNNKIKEHKLPEKMNDNINIEVIGNVLKNRYKLEGAKSVDNFRDTILGGLMDYPLEATEFGHDILALFSTPYITNRATKPDQIGKSRISLLKKKDPHLTEQYEKVYNLTTRMYTDSMYPFAKEIIDEVNNKLDNNNKLNREGDTSKYGKYVLPIISQEIAKFAVIKGLFPDTKYEINQERGGITYNDYDALKRKSLKSLGIPHTSQENEAEDLVLALKSGIRNISKKDKAQLVKAIYKMIEGTNLKNFEMAEMIVDRTKSGMELRVDAAKDFANMDGLRNGLDRFDDNWNEAIRVLGAIGQGVQEVNPNTYIVPEITNEVDLYKLGEGDMSGRFNWIKDVHPIEHSDNISHYYVNDLIKKLIREGNANAVANYQSYFSNVESIFGKRGDDGADWGADQYNRMFQIFAKAPSVYHKNVGGIFGDSEEFLYSGQLDSIIKSYTFVENHDKPRINHILSLDMGLFFANLDYNSKPEEKDYRRRAYAVLNPDKNPNDTGAVDSFDFSNVSSMAVARGESLNKAFEESVKAVATKKDTSNKDLIPQNQIGQVIFNLKKIVAELASGRDEEIRFEPDNFGVEEVHKLIDIILTKYAKKHSELSANTLNLLYDATYEEMMKRPLNNSLGITKFLVAAPGIPTVYSGYTNSGFERKTKNSFQDNRSANRPDFEDRYEFVREAKANRDDVLLLRSRPVLHALNDGGVFLLKQQATNQGKNVTGLLRYAPDGSAVITLFNVSGTTHDYRGQNNPLMNGVDLAGNRIDLSYDGKEGYQGLHGGLRAASDKGPGMKFVNAYDENDVYEVFNSDGRDGYYLAKEKDCKTPICLKDNIMVLYHASDVLKEKDKAFIERVKKAKENHTSFCGRQIVENKVYNVSPANYKKTERAKTGSKLELVSR